MSAPGSAPGVRPSLRHGISGRRTCGCAALNIASRMSDGESESWVLRLSCCAIAVLPRLSHRITSCIGEARNQLSRYCATTKYRLRTGALQHVGRCLHSANHSSQAAVAGDCGGRSPSSDALMYERRYRHTLARGAHVPPMPPAPVARAAQATPHHVAIDAPRLRSLARSNPARSAAPPGSRPPLPPPSRRAVQRAR